MRIAFDRLVRRDGTVQLPMSCCGKVVTILLPDLDEEKKGGKDLEILRAVANLADSTSSSKSSELNT